MNSKLMSELSQIRGGTAELQQQKHIMWLTAANKRQEFLAELVEDIKVKNEDGAFACNKAKRSYYSTEVAEYDRNNSQVFYNN